MGEKERSMQNRTLDRVNVLGRPRRQRDVSERNCYDGYNDKPRRLLLAELPDQDFTGDPLAEAEHHDRESDLSYEDQVGRDAQIRTLGEPFRCARFTPAEHRWLQESISVPYCAGPRPEPKPIPSPGWVPYVGRK